MYIFYKTVRIHKIDELIYVSIMNYTYQIRKIENMQNIIYFLLTIYNILNNIFNFF